MIRTVLFGLTALAAGTMPLSAKASGIEFTPSDMIGWSVENFAGLTDYEVVQVDGREALHAQCQDAGSGLFLEREIDLTETPIMEWSWRVDETFGPDIDETTRAGDDYPVRVYVVQDGGILQWRSRAINYVWASAQPAGGHWPNAYVSQARVVALQSGEPDSPGQWVTERRNVREDFKTFHDRDLDSIDAVALMTDCNDVGGSIEGWYGSIRFLPEG